MGTKFTQAFDGEWIRPRKKGYKIACCDCGLIHKLEFRIRDGHIEFRPFRDNRATGQRRRYRKKSLPCQPVT